MEIINLQPRHKEIKTRFDRQYQSYSLLQQINLSPVDKQEALNQKQQHQLLKEVWIDWPQHRLYSKIVGEPRRILDCGFGTADWAIEVARNNPHATVEAIDISPHLVPKEKPSNLRLRIGNLNEKTPFSKDTFDFVHSRFIAGGLGWFRWPSYLCEMHRILRPGGWIQIIEWELRFRSANGETNRLRGLKEWLKLYESALASSGYPEGRKATSIAESCGTWMRTAGFREFQTSVKEIPTCGWPTDPHKKRLGERNLFIMRELIDSLAVYPVVTRNQASIEQFRRVSAQAKAELALAEAQPYIRLYACWGKKG